jgi:CheY-like chemotaxis protein
VSEACASKPRLLIVEDEMLLAMTLEEYLRGEGYDTVCAARLGQAMRLAQAEDASFDAAILDVNLGGEKVFPLATVLAERGVPFVFASAYGGRGTPEEFASRPVLGKPYLAADMVRVLDGLIGR